MPTIWGDNAAFDDARDKVYDALVALAADMVTDSISPLITTVYLTHWTDPALVFNSVSIGIRQVDSVGMGTRIEYLYRIELRVMTGNDNKPFDEVTFYQLANSILNWFFSHATLGDGYHVKQSVPVQVEPNIVFSDTRSLGGRVLFTIFGQEEYTQL